MGLLDTLKDAAEIVQKADNIDLVRQLMKAQQDAFALLEENRTLKEQLREREDRERVREQLEFRENAYWRKDEPNRAYCPRCWDSEQKLIGVLVFEDGMYRCLNCKTDWPRNAKHSRVRPRAEFI